MIIVFDLSGTVFGAVDKSLRPGIKETINGLRSSGIQVHFWTNGPVDYYAGLLRDAGIAGDVYKKGELHFKPDICVDDEPLTRMPYKVYRVSMHISNEMQGEKILVAELVFSGDLANFYWD